MSRLQRIMIAVLLTGALGASALAIEVHRMAGESDRMLAAGSESWATWAVERSAAARSAAETRRLRHDLTRLRVRARHAERRLASALRRTRRARPLVIVARRAP